MATRVMLADNKPISDELIQMHLDECGFLWGQPKIDGMRVFVNDDALPTSRSGKEFKHRYLRQWTQAHPSLRGLDGEVVAGHIYTEDTFRDSMSGIRAEEGDPAFTYYMFDYTENDYHKYSYKDRMNYLAAIRSQFGEFQQIEGGFHCRLLVCPTQTLTTLLEVQEFEQKCLADKWEGAMLRRPDRPYKFGRSTNRGGELVKLKRFVDAEAIVVGFEPWYINENEATESALGYTVRSSHKDGKIPIERLGALSVELLSDRSVKFKIGVLAGVTHLDRDRLWADRDAYIGRICKFKHQGYGGGYDAPRAPVFLNWRLDSEF